MTSAHIVVVHEEGDRTFSAVRHGIELAQAAPDARLTVVHKASVGVTVRNGPTPEMAERLGNPTWARVHSTTMAAGADPQRTMVAAASTTPEKLIRRHAPDATTIVLGAVRRRSLFAGDPAARLATALGCPVVRAPLTTSTTPPDRRATPAPSLAPLRRAAA